MKQLNAFLMILAMAAALVSGCAKNDETSKQTSSSAAPGPVKVLDDSTFEAQIQKGVVLVDFWATWCGPCRTQGPIVEQVAGKVEGKAVVAKLDVDAAPKTANQFNVRSIPTLIIFKDGKPVKQFVGVTEAEKLVSAINEAVEAK